MPPELWDVTDRVLKSQDLACGDAFAVGALALALLDHEYAILGNLVLPHELATIPLKKQAEAAREMELAKRMPDFSDAQVGEVLAKRWHSQLHVMGSQQEELLRAVVSGLLKRDPGQRMTLAVASETLGKCEPWPG